MYYPSDLWEALPLEGLGEQIVGLVLLVVAFQGRSASLSFLGCSRVLLPGLIRRDVRLDSC